jgi:hypothetical protein
MAWHKLHAATSCSYDLIFAVKSGEVAVNYRKTFYE